MRTHFNFPEYCEHMQYIVTRDELACFLPQILATKLNFEVVNLGDGNYCVECRSENDNDVCLRKEYEMSK
jgi:hypothetical protein